MKAPINEGTYKIVAHFAGNTFLQASDSGPVLLKVEKHGTSISLQIKGNPTSGASLFGDLIDLTNHKGISAQRISFTTNDPHLVIPDVSTDTKGKYIISLPKFECGMKNIEERSYFVGTDVYTWIENKSPIHSL